MLGAALALFVAYQASPEAEALDRMVKAIGKPRALSLTIVGGIGKRMERVSMRMLAPGMFSAVGTSYNVHSDGKRAWQISESDRTWNCVPMESELKTFKSLPGFGVVFAGAEPTKAVGKGTIEEFAGVKVFALPIVNLPWMSADVRTVLLLDPKTGLPRGMKTIRDEKPYETFGFEDIVLNPPLKPADFRFTVPKGRNWAWPQARPLGTAIVS